MWAQELNGLGNGVGPNHVLENGAQCTNVEKKKFIRVPKLEALGSRKSKDLVPNGITSKSNKCQLNNTNILDLKNLGSQDSDLNKSREPSVQERFKGLKIYEVRSHCWDSASDHSNASTSSSGVQKQIKVPVLQKRGSLKSSSHIGNQHFQLKQVTPDGLVKVQPLLSTVSSHLESYQLDDLQFFYQTTVLSSALRNWTWNRPSYKVTFGNNHPNSLKNQQPPVRQLSSSLSSVTKCPNWIRLYQDFPHGRVYINRQIQLELHRTITSAYYKYFNEPRRVKVAKVADNGNIWLHLFPQFQERILNIADNVPLPEPIGLLELLKKSASELKNRRYLIPLEGSFRRIQIHQVLYGLKKLLVSFVDLASDPEEIRVDFVYDCYQIDPNLANFPPLVKKCHIQGIVSLDMDQFDTTSDLYFFVQFVNQVAENVDCVNQVHLWDDMNRYVNQLLVDNGTAVPEPREELLDWYSQENYCHMRNPS